jgi:uncharacterized membrane protein YiaA
MLRACGLAVQKTGDKTGKALSIYTLSTARSALIAIRAIFVHILNTGFCYLSAAFSQFFYPLALDHVSTFSTGPINTTKLIKE